MCTCMYTGIAFSTICTCYLKFTVYCLCSGIRLKHISVISFKRCSLASFKIALKTLSPSPSFTFTLSRSLPRSQSLSLTIVLSPSHYLSVSRLCARCLLFTQFHITRSFSYNIPIYLFTLHTFWMHDYRVSIRLELLTMYWCYLYTIYSDEIQRIKFKLEIY